MRARAVQKNALVLVMLALHGLISFPFMWTDFTETWHLMIFGERG